MSPEAFAQSCWGGLAGNEYFKDGSVVCVLYDTRENLSETMYNEVILII